jgi:hypothetical protein
VAASIRAGGSVPERPTRRALILGAFGLSSLTLLSACGASGAASATSAATTATVTAPTAGSATASSATTTAPAATTSAIAKPVASTASAVKGIAFLNTKPQMKYFVGELATTHLQLYVPGSEEIFKVQSQMYTDVLSGKVSAADGVANSVSQVQAILDKNAASS